MRPYWIAWCVGLVCFLTLTPAWAHHGGGGGTTFSGGQTALDRVYPPRTTANFDFEFNFLDNDVGHTLLYQVRGEYAFLQRFSIGALVPVWTADNAFVPDNTRLGDVGLLFKAQVLGSKRLGINWLAGLNTFFPTGNDNISLGAGAFSLAPYMTFLKQWNRLGVYLSAGTTVELAGAINPTLNYEVGLLGKVLTGRVPLTLIFSYQGVTFVQSDTFTEGATKGYLQPGVEVGLGEHWTVTLLGRIGIVDTLSFKNNVSFHDFATGLFSDIEGSFLFNLGYEF